MASKMPQFDLDQVRDVLTTEEYKLFQLTLNKDRLRATPPNEKKCGELVGEAYYLWRWLCFSLCGFAPHNSMPMIADYKFNRLSWLRHSDKSVYEAGKAQHKAKLAELDSLIEKILDSQPVTSQKGVLQWGQALGYF